MGEVVLVRHIETEFNDNPKRHRGVLDIPPSPEGVAKSKPLAVRLVSQEPQIIKLYSSPLTRTKMMADEIGKAARVPVDVRQELQTWNTGDLVGRPLDEVKPVLIAYSGPKRNELWPGMKETFEQFLHRWLGFLSILLDHPHQGAVVCCTQGTNVGSALQWDRAGRPGNVSNFQFKYEDVEMIKPAHWVKMKEMRGHGPVQSIQGPKEATAGVLS